MTIARLLGEHAVLAVIPVVLALIVSVPLGYLVFKTGAAANSILAVFGVIYSIPSLALFVALPLVLGTPILSPLNVAVALAIYSVALLVRSVVDGLRSVPAAVKQSATAVGFGWFRRLARVELPLAMPVIFAGLRVVDGVQHRPGQCGGPDRQRRAGQAVRPRSEQPVLHPADRRAGAQRGCWPWSPTRLILLIQRGTLPWARKRRLA